jgi:hypothetical protein
MAITSDLVDNLITAANIYGWRIDALVLTAIFTLVATSLPRIPTQLALARVSV